MSLGQSRSLRQADGADFGRREYGRWDHRVIDLGRLLAKHRVGEGVAFADRNWRQVDPVRHIADGVDDIIQGRAVTGVSTGTEPIPGVAFVSIDQDVQWSVGVITPAAERRQHVRNFGVIAANIGRELHALVPQAGPPPAAT